MFRNFLFASLLINLCARGQQLSQPDYASLKMQEDSLSYFAKGMIFDSFPENRFRYDSLFIRLFVKALKTPNSFEYTFDSLYTVSRLYAPDSSFRIFTWQLQKDESYYRQEGAIQMKTKDGSLQLFPLFDASDYTSMPADSIRTNRNWIGAIYYNIILKEYKGKNIIRSSAMMIMISAAHVNGSRY